ncbi:substrate-binding periplasmic protein [Azospirillum rugosum]|uniref:Polar amino acid transport system substrate-binding protein/histidine transport system substrate-binding protein n=1 Tax=Azospirillum rugosum TaxID=416170 RepID=A0ABS4T0X3_9PROT|nr:transporter substrate-binding domain-containing protein [Azospirillum rugosum]MBP2297295.1 polar amino acid transport system substrate-binding protein/histidine transport system substrate-binding protein [Azospirillum rugosum]MDQ0531136.1 polar amino acid transport system substrate-binding protein/histidine transport system substrate-binding protein [Azospirillum rugosum]
MHRSPIARRVATCLLGGLFAVVLAAAYATPARADEVLRVLTWKMAPYGMVDDQGRLTGFEVEIARALCATMGVRCEIDMLPFPEVLELLERNGADFAVASILKTPERAKKYLFTDRYKRSSSCYIGRAGEWPLGAQPVLAGKRISVTRGSKQQDYFRTRDTGGIIQVFDDQGEAIQAVADGRVDLALAPSTVAVHLLTSNEGQNLEVIGEPISEGGLGGESAIALPLGREELRDRVNQALRAILADGRYDAISSRFLPFRVY